MSAQSQTELVDRFMEMYVEWREECAGLWAAYERWSSGPVANRVLAHASYAAALDREEWACRVYADLAARVASRAPGEAGSAPLAASLSPGSEPLFPAGLHLSA